MSPSKKHLQRSCDETPQASEGSTSERKGTHLLTHLQTHSNRVKLRQRKEAKEQDRVQAVQQVRLWATTCTKIDMFRTAAHLQLVDKTT